ncbi:hypothetical protein R2601_04103 [Salipiger bermudensis HTCC2601]|uniref:HTH gntR-type domain-containing protein n=2 Tax=Salipiger TaxID=263377 RepID=Q0FW25_SALBH|nr:hypothetical protein R2601_04103 [Salipiger bermudensis HTCC2601]
MAAPPPRCETDRAAHRVGARAIRLGGCVGGAGALALGASSSLPEKGPMELPPHAQGRRSQLSQDVASYVRELIISGRARRDDYLRIDTIAKAMGISSTPVREGLLMLQLEGFVKLVPRHGFRVVGVEPQDVLDIFWAQGVLAGELAARAAMRASEDELSELEALIEAHSRAVAAGDEPSYTRLGHQFHRAVNLAARSNRLANLLGNMTKQLPNQFYGKIEGQIEGSLEYHPRILEAIRGRDAEAARAQMVEHIVSGGDALVQYLEDQGLWAEDRESDAGA